MRFPAGSTSLTSAGCHHLIRDGAALLTGVDDILSELSYLKGFRKAPAPAKPDGGREAPDADLTEEERRILAVSAEAILTQDAISERSGLASPRVAAGLMMLEIKGSCPSASTAPTRGLLS